MAESTTIGAIKIAERYAEKLREKINIHKMVLFGSHIKQTSTYESDIDIAIVSPDFTGKIEQDFLLAMKICRQVDLRIEPHPYLPEDFETDAFAQKIIKEGIEIDLLG
jgi:predicted nucleotidyltransferase